MAFESRGFDRIPHEFGHYRDFRRRDQSTFDCPLRQFAFGSFAGVLYCTVLPRLSSHERLQPFDEVRDNSRLPLGLRLGLADWRLPAVLNGCLAPNSVVRKPLRSSQNPPFMQVKVLAKGRSLVRACSSERVRSVRSAPSPWLPRCREAPGCGILHALAQAAKQGEPLPTPIPRET